EAQYFNFTANNLSQELTAWGKVGFGLWANDYMEESTNNFGIRKTELYVDGHLLFHSDVNDIPVGDNLQVNAWGDYDHYSKSHVWYMRSFLLPGITLPFCSADENRGIIDFKEERPYRFTYILSDFKGNKSEYTFTVIGKKTPIHRTKLAHPLHTLVWNRLNNYQLPGLQLQVPSRYLVENVVLTPRVSTKENSFSSSYQLSEKSIALLKHCKLSLQVKKEVKDPSKLYIISHSKTDKFVGGEYKDGWVTAKILDLNAEYELAYDVNAPKIEYEGQNGDVIRFNLTDEESGIKHFEGSIDGRFVLFEKVGRSSFIACKLKGTPVKKTGKKHNLELTVTDHRNNQSNYKTQIIY
ncbi:MAG: M23 family peptidase, partial [Prevotella sp.]|nr:M23 family peptidase [Prevotella sp.]